MDCYVGEIRLFASDQIPSSDGWALCNGQQLQVRSNMALFSLIGNKFGGDGQETFNLPTLNGRVIIGTGVSPVSGTGYQTGAVGGEDFVKLTTATMPVHSHSMVVHNSYDTSLPGTNILGNPCIPTDPNQLKKNAFNASFYVSSVPDRSKIVALHPASIGLTGASVPHDNRQPFLTLVYCIATQGYYPPRPY
ncbi:MAG: Microcystin-dependent protein [Bacteroidetes bacterium]|nr:Microcystin-dependent protein [Bacteroidota bacterium]